MNSSDDSSFGLTVFGPALPSGDQSGRGYCKGFDSPFFISVVVPASFVFVGAVALVSAGCPWPSASRAGVGEGVGLAFGAACCCAKKNERSDCKSASLCSVLRSSAFDGGESLSSSPVAASAREGAECSSRRSARQSAAQRLLRPAKRLCERVIGNFPVGFQRLSEEEKGRALNCRRLEEALMKIGQ